MLKKIKEFFMGKPAEVMPAPVETVPYKVPEPAATTPIPLVVETAPVQVVDQVAVVSAAEGSAVTDLPVKKTTKSRAPKTAPVAVVKEKAPAKAKAPKATKSKKV